MMSLSIIILAAGQGTRMYSELPKVLHQLAGKSLLEHVHHTASMLETRGIHVIYGYGGDQLIEEHSHLDVDWVEQKEQLGTGHAVKQALPNIPDKDLVLVLYGDVPLITNETLTDLVNAAEETTFSLLTTFVEDPRGYGRIVRNGNDEVSRIVEDKDASNDEKRISEINTGMMVVNGKALKQWVEKLEDNNAQGELYLTDIIEMAVNDGIKVNAVQPYSEVEIRGVNDRAQLAELERYYQLIQAHQLMRRGITIMDPGRFDLRGDLEIDSDCYIDINVILEGRLKIGSGVRIGANCIIKDTVIDDGVEILPNSVIENAVIGKACRIGPFARIRPETVLNENVHIGNFVEIKKSVVGSGSKVNHLSYIGDSEVGTNTNIGAGVITCNYDGANKHKTIIGDNVFIGSDVQLVAPVSVSSGATIAAGTTITKDVAENELALSRTPQKSMSDWKRPEKK
ncbi:MAG: UDP-N-acetylglucosamine diphosphorylase/glucosamine-1-phosphate N-acetyltransferase [Gammaproteobacteria bacterium]|nr:MAG: UDP-N-acetylglucosamine diphosphorylase/glucosamine-1-phosphate N-acetyltransferase [Gammaproteobacteria bacterium]RKZ71083.1 MAG: UDP-N-acetylglucosamine diphosphorylase/glucosamine-1-phosphate N-acetyltransferase [Gammaproteobacteria bacterium]